MKGLTCPSLALGLHGRCLLSTTWKLPTCCKNHLEFSQPHVLPSWDVKKTGTGLGHVRLRLPFCTLQKSCSAHLQALTNHCIGTTWWVPSEQEREIAPISPKHKALSQPLVLPGCDTGETWKGHHFFIYAQVFGMHLITKSKYLLSFIKTKHSLYLSCQVWFKYPL